MSKKAYHNNSSRRAAKNHAPIQQKEPKWTKPQGGSYKPKRAANQQPSDRKAYTASEMEKAAAPSEEEKVIPEIISDELETGISEEQGTTPSPEKTAPSQMESDTVNGTRVVRNLKEEMERRGFQIVNRRFITKRPDYVCFRGKRICFYKGVMDSLGHPDYLIFYMNEAERHFAVIPTDKPASENSENILPTTRAMKNGSMVFTHTLLVTRIYELMGWDPDMRYLVQGQSIQALDGSMMDFDLSSASGLSRKITLYEGLV